MAMHCSTDSLKWMCFLSPGNGDCAPDEDIEDSRLGWFSLLSRLEEYKGVKSGVAVPPRPGRTSPSDCCACTAAAACLRSDEDDNDLWSIISDILRFFNIGFLCKKEFDFDIRLLLKGGLEGDGIRRALSDPV